MTATAAEKQAETGLSIEKIAIVCHQANKAWCVINGDSSQVDWPVVADWQRESAIKGVQFALNNPDAPDSAQHDSWCIDKINAGWRYGPTKDADKKQHPCLVTFDELPEHQQKKDKLFRAIVNALK